MMLKAKLRAIQTELNTSIRIDIVDEYKEKLHLSGQRKIKKNSSYLIFSVWINTPDDSTEFAVLKGYLDTVFSIPWKKQKSAKIDIQRVRKELDHHHFGLDSC